MDQTIMPESSDRTQVSKSVKMRQDISGFAFVLMYCVTFIFQFMAFFSIIPPQTTSYIMWTGTLSIVAYVFLFSLSNNISCEFFVGTLIATEVFFSFIMPYALTHSYILAEHNITFLSICICLCILSVYIWMVLISNNPFSRGMFRWLVWLPAPYVLSICNYWTMVSLYTGHKSMLDTWHISSNFLLPLSWLLIPVLCMGYWKLCHAPCFSSKQASMQDSQFYSINRFLIIYTSAIALAFILF